MASVEEEAVKIDTPQLVEVAAPPVQPAAIVDPNQIRTLFKGKKYNWQAKVNFHIHIIEHTYHDTIEVVVYHTGTFVEAPHVYVPQSVVGGKVHVEVRDSVVQDIRQEFAHQHVEPPTPEEIADVMRRNEIAAFILDRINVTLHPEFVIDVRDFENSYRIAMGARAEGENTDEALANEARRMSIVNAQWSKDVLSGALSGVANAHFANYGDVEPASFSLVHPRPHGVHNSYIKRIGKSTTLIGEAMRDEKISRYQKLLQELVTKYTSAEAQHITKDTAHRISFLNKAHRSRNIARKVMTTFHKFKHDEDLLQASLAYLHISDLFALQTVCRLWHRVLFATLRGTTHMHISSRDAYMQEMPHLTALGASVVGYRRKRNAGNIRPRLGTDGSQQDSTAALSGHSSRNNNQTEDEQYSTAEMERLQWRDVFVFPATVLRALTSSAMHLHTLRLHYVILDSEVLSHLRTLDGVLKHLSLGVIRIDDGAMEEEHPGVGGNSAMTGLVPHPPDADHKPSLSPYPERKLHRVLSNPTALPGASLPAGAPTDPPAAQSDAEGFPSSASLNATATPPVVRTGKGILNRRKLQAQAAVATAAQIAAVEAAALAASLEPQPERRPTKPVAQLRPMNGQDVVKILAACGAELTHLELSVTIGPIPQEAFRQAPRLHSLAALDAVPAPSIRSRPWDFAGAVPLYSLTKALAGITVPSLLCLISDSLTEALALTDRRGFICLVSGAFEQLTGHTSDALRGQTVQFLCGKQTDPAEVQRLDACMADQTEALECTTFFHRASGSAFLAQMIVVPNIVVHQGLPLDQHCLSLEYLEQLAFGLPEAEVRSTPKTPKTNTRQSRYVKQNENIKDFVQGMREHHYHLIRLGALSQPFYATKE